MTAQAVTKAEMIRHHEELRDAHAIWVQFLKYPQTVCWATANEAREAIEAMPAWLSVPTLTDEVKP